MRWRLAQLSFVQSSVREQRGQTYGRSTQRSTICRSAFSVVRKSQTCGDSSADVGDVWSKHHESTEGRMLCRGKKTNVTMSLPIKQWVGVLTKEKRQINWQQWLSSVMDLQKVGWLITWDTVMFMRVGDPNKQAVQTWCCKPPESFYSEKRSSSLNYTRALSCIAVHFRASPCISVHRRAGRRFDLSICSSSVLINVLYANGFYFLIYLYKVCPDLFPRILKLFISFGRKAFGIISLWWTRNFKVGKFWCLESTLSVQSDLKVCEKEVNLNFPCIWVSFHSLLLQVNPYVLVISSSCLRWIDKNQNENSNWIHISNFIMCACVYSCVFLCVLLTLELSFFHIGCYQKLEIPISSTI